MARFISVRFRLCLAAILLVPTITRADEPLKKTTHVYKTIGDTKIHADVYRPDDTKVRPVIVWIHGGALIMGSRAGVPEQLLGLCRREGYALVSLDYRLAPEVKLPDIIDDIKDAFRWLHDKGPKLLALDPDKMIVAGGSAGGYLTMMTGTCVTPRPKALVAYWGYGDVDGEWYTKPSEFYRKQPLVAKEEADKAIGGTVLTGSGGESGRARGRYYLYLRQNGLWTKEVTGFDPDTERRKLDPYCPVRNITAEYPPILMIHGTKDDDVPYELSAAMAKELTKHQVPHEFVTVPDAGHGLAGGDKKLIAEANEKAAAFIRKHLGAGARSQTTPQRAPGGPVAYRGARIYTVAGAPIENGVLIIDKGKIVAVGPAADTRIPDGAAVIDVSGKVIIPGLVDTHSHVGIYPKPMVPAHSDGNEGSGAVQSSLRALDAIWPDDPGIHMAVAGGVTTANIMPGSGNVIGGQTLYVKLRGRDVETMHIVDGKVLGGLKMANGENPKNFNFTRSKMPPATRMKLAAMQREQFIKARDYEQKWSAYRKAAAAGKDVSPPESDLGMESLVEVLQRKRTVHFHSHRADDLMTAVRLAEEFGFELVLQHATEGYRVADELARRKIPASLTLVDSPGGKMETAGLLEENAGVLDKAGVLVAINTDDFITESRFFLRTGAIALRGGMSEDAALRAQTINPARMMHLEDRLGSLEKGKDADFVILSGLPYSVYSHVLETYIEGIKVFDRSQHRDWTYQAGGFAVADSSRVPKAPAALRPQPAASGQGRETSPKRAGGKDAVGFTGTPTHFAIVADRIHTVGKGTIANGIIIVKDGRIESVGPANEVKLAADLPILHAAVVTPGLIDAHSVVPPSGALNLTADQDQDEMSDPNQADLRVLDAFNPNEALLEFLRREGVTTIRACPGRANVIAGQAGIFRTWGSTTEKMTVRFPAALLVNLGESPKRAYPNKLPTTRMGTAALVRNALVQAQTDARKRAAAKDDDKRPPRNLKLEALAQALDGKLPVIFAAQRADDLETALRLAKEFKLSAELDLAAEAYLMADRIAAAKVSVVVHPTMQRPAEMETFNSHLCNAAVLAEHHIPLAIGTGFEGYVPKTRVVRHEAGMAMVNGLGFDRALRAITQDAAKLLGIDDRFGSIEPGKVADLVLYDGDPFEHATHVTHTILDGRVVYDRFEYLKLPFARRALPLTSGSGVGCCMEVW